MWETEPTAKRVVGALSTPLLLGVFALACRDGLADQVPQTLGTYGPVLVCGIIEHLVRAERLIHRHDILDDVSR